MRIPHRVVAAAVVFMVIGAIFVHPTSSLAAQIIPASTGSTTGVSQEGYTLFFPFASPNTDPTLWYFDDFSNPQSGWYIFEEDISSNGYVDNEYELRVKTQGGASWSVPPGRLIEETQYKSMYALLSLVKDQATDLCMA